MRTIRMMLLGWMLLVPFTAQTIYAEAPALANTTLWDEPAKAPPAEIDADNPAFDPFAKDRFSLAFTGGGYQEYNGRETVYFGAATIGYYFDQDFTVQGEFLGYHVNNIHGPDSDAFGFNIIARWHFCRVDRLGFFIEAGAGIFEGSKRTPAGGTHHNYTPQAGLGLTYHLWDNVHLIAAARYFHLSNASRYGLDRNPSIDAFGGYLGFLFTF